MEKRRIYFTCCTTCLKLSISGVKVAVILYEYRATKGIRLPNPNAFELTLMIGGA